MTFSMNTVSSFCVHDCDINAIHIMLNISIMQSNSTGSTNKFPQNAHK